MQDNDSRRLLEKACKLLNLHLVECNGSFQMYDADGRMYNRYADYYNGSTRISSIEDFLNTKTFEHFSFPWSEKLPAGLKIVENPFFKMSKEEFYVKLDLLGVDV